MPPSKGRMMGLKGGESLQPALDFRAVKSLGPRKKRAGFGGKGRSVKSLKQDEGFQALRIPSSISKALPSVRKFSGGKTFVDVTDDGSECSSNPDELKVSGGVLSGLKRGRGFCNKYQIRLKTEAKFDGMVWDVAFAANGNVVVSCGDGVVLCDADLVKKVTLDNIRLAGGVDFLSDGRIVAVCRFTDMVNIYTDEGVFLSAFSGGESPMSVCVTPKDEIVVADPGAKQVHRFNSAGENIGGGIAREGSGYSLQWPLYMTIVNRKSESVVVSDCHQQAVFIFNHRGYYQRTLQLKTFGGNEVLRPHGVCSTEDGDLIVIDNAIDSIEVFKFDGTYMQTLVPSCEGTLMRPKVLSCKSDRGLFAIGGLQGNVRLYELIDTTKFKGDELKVKVEGSVPLESLPEGETTKRHNDVIVLD